MLDRKKGSNFQKNPERPKHHYDPQFSPITVTPLVLSHLVKIVTLIGKKKEKKVYFSLLNYPGGG